MRVQAHEIRRLLKKYYEEDGGSSLIRMELPPGHYVPVFMRVGAEIGSDVETVPPALVAEPRYSSIKSRAGCGHHYSSGAMCGTLFSWRAACSNGTGANATRCGRSESES